MNYINSLTQKLGIFGWNFSLVTDIKLTTDSNNNIYISNLGIDFIFIFEQQLQEEKSLSDTYSIESQQLLQFYSSKQLIFQQQSDGSYAGNSGTLSWNVDHYELEEANGSKIVFRSDGRLNYVEYSNGYRLSAEYTDGLLTKLSGNNGDSFTFGYNSDQRIETVTDSDGLVDTYSYDDNNRLVEVIDSDNKLTQYEYDAFGNRTATIYNGQRTEYLIDPFGYGDVIAEYDGDGNLIAKYEHGIGLVSRTDASNNKAFYDFDGTGSTAALTGQAGNELNSYNYPPRRLQHSLCVLI